VGLLLDETLHVCDYYRTNVCALEMEDECLCGMIIMG
jgi:hypothetical protein